MFLFTTSYCSSSLDWGSIAQWVSGIAALLVFFYALYRDNISYHFRKPKLKFVKIIKSSQKSECVCRLVIKNDSNHLAKNVEFDIERIIHNKKRRENFIPAPLSWTHNNKNPFRDIYPKQTTYLDVITIKENKNPMVYAPNIWDIPNLVEIKEGSTTLELKYYTENGKTDSLKLEVNWNNASEGGICDSLKITII